MCVIAGVAVVVAFELFDKRFIYILKIGWLTVLCFTRRRWLHCYAPFNAFRYISE